MNRKRARDGADAGRGRPGFDRSRPAPLTPTSERSATPRLVRRDALFDLLSSSPPDSVVLVCAPAGSGKTMLVRSWLEADGAAERTAWVTVDPHEGDAQHFWLEAIDALAGATGDAVQRITPAPGLRGEAAVERVLKEVRALQTMPVLVIDDLHELQSPEGLEWLEVLIAGRPAGLRIILTSRVEPKLNLHHLRLAGELTEIGASSLRFSAREAGELLEASDVAISDQSVKLLQERTEGWAAGLRLAAISLAGHPDPERFVREFSGSERGVAGYLMAEVLGCQSSEVREVLLRTSILDRVTGRLADALTGRTGSERILLDLEDKNAFVTSLDADRTLFRYHPLFADFLRLELRRSDPTEIESLHQTAARWYEEHGQPTEAIRQAQAASDWTYATRLLADGYISLILDGRLQTVAGLLATFPAGAAAQDAELAIVCAAARLFAGGPEETEAYIDVAEHLAESVAEQRRPRFELRVASTKLWLARRRVDLAAALEAKREVEAALAAQSAIDAARVADHRAAEVMNVGITELWSLRTDEARRHLEEALSLAHRAQRPYVEISCLAHLGIAGPDGGGSVLDGVHYAEQAIAGAEARGWGEEAIITPALAISGVGLMWLGQFEEAERRLQRADGRLRPEEDPMTTLVVRWASGLLRLAQGRLQNAFAALAEAQGLSSLMGKEVRTIEPLGVLLQTQVRMGGVSEASASLAALDEDERDRALVRIAAAEIHIAQDDPDAALAVLAPVIDGSRRASHSTTSLIDAQLYIALARARLGDARATEQAIETALELAEREGIIIPFAVAPVGELLERHPRHRTAHASLLSEILDVRRGAFPKPHGPAPGAAEDLSEAELRVARFLPSNLKAPEIAAELFVSPNTVRTHLRHIYAKLGAHSRAEAVARARELGVLAPSRIG